MAVIGTLAFNFSVTIPLLVTAHPRRRRRHLHAAVLGAERRLARRRAHDRPPQDGHQPQPGRLVHRLRRGDARPGRGRRPAGSPSRSAIAARLRQRRLPHRPRRPSCSCSPTRRTGDGCSRCRRWCSSAARRSADPIVGWVSDIGGPRAGVVVGGRRLPGRRRSTGSAQLRGVAPTRADDAAPAVEDRCPTRPSPSPTERPGARARERVGSAAAPHPHRSHGGDVSYTPHHPHRCPAATRPDHRRGRSRATTCRGPSPTTLLCCLPAGIVSIVFAAQVDGKWNSGDYAGARRRPRRRPAPGRSCPPWSASCVSVDLHRRRRRRIVGLTPRP